MHNLSCIIFVLVQLVENYSKAKTKISQALLEMSGIFLQRSSFAEHQPHCTVGLQAALWGQQMAAG